MRRKRNQKKDVSVVEQLESNSLEVEPTEVIFAPDGTEWRSRAISGMPYDDGFPFPQLSPSHQQLQTCERAPLSEIDGNRSGSGNSHPVWSRQNRRKSKHSDIKANENLVPPSIINNAEANKQQPATNEPTRKRKKEFNVFKDEVNFSNPAGLSYLTAELASPGLAPSNISRHHKDRSVWSREGSMNNHHFGTSNFCRSRRNPRPPCERQGRRCASSSLASSNRNGDHAISSSYPSHFLMEPNARLPQYIATGSNPDANQRHGQSALQSQLDQQQEQQHNNLLNNFTISQNDAYLTTTTRSVPSELRNCGKACSVLQDFPYYLSQMPFLTDTLTASSNFGSSATFDSARNGNSQRSTKSTNPNFFLQSGLQTEFSQGGFNTYDLPIEEQLKLYATNEALDSNGRGLGGPLEHGSCYGCYHQQDHLVDDEEAETEDDQKTISAPPSER